ncbi:MAG: hypothetical protein HY482_00425 [Candidatus Wildermuthbacteria bacterium]|nr:hypothetical protein [Candidatus Wildermuthbacteria bacterium]
MLNWEWSEGGGGTIERFHVEYGLKRDRDDQPILSCADIGEWLVPGDQPGVGSVNKQVVVDSGETYCWRIYAKASADGFDSDSVLGPEFTANSEVVSICGNNICEVGEGGGGSCPADCPVSGEPTFGTKLNPISSDNLLDLLRTVLNFMFVLAIAILPIVIVYGGILMLGSGGDPARIKKGREVLLWAVLAFAVILLARGLPAVLRYF